MRPFVALDRPVLVDLALAAASLAVAGVGLTVDGGDGGAGATVVAVALVAAAAVALLVRRRRPIPVLLLVVGARVLVTLLTGNEQALLPAAAIALYTVARSGDRRPSLAIGIATALTMAVAVSVAAMDEPFHGELIGEVAIGLLPVALGDAARSRADRLRQLIDTEAEARVQAERLRIARDLHDVVAHGLSAIAVQSGVAAHLLDSDPAQARQSLENINATGRQSLEELRSMVGVLRSTNDQALAPLTPTPADPNDLSAVITAAERLGVLVDTDVVGSFPAGAAESVVVAIHRILHEGLTNVARHAPDAIAVVRLVHGQDGVTLTVSNEVGRRPGDATVPSTGIGIIGMIERAESVGGSLQAGSVGDGFEVRARIPYDADGAGGVAP